MPGKLKTIRSGSSLFLIELIIIIGFFSVASVVCMQLFVRARQTSMASRDLSRAALCVQSAAEAFKAGNGDATLAAEAMGGTATDYGFEAVYDEALKPVKENGAAVYRLTLSREEHGALVIARIVFTRLDTSEPVCALDVSALG